MSNSIDWLKKNGNPITTNDHKATIAKAKELGWKRAGAKPKPKPKPKAKD